MTAIVTSRGEYVRRQIENIANLVRDETATGYLTESEIETITQALFEAMRVADEVIRTRRFNAAREARADQPFRAAELDMFDRYAMQVGYDDPFEIFDPPIGGAT
jgi:hypothetical protein